MRGFEFAQTPPARNGKPQAFASRAPRKRTGRTLVADLGATRALLALFRNGFADFERSYRPREYTDLEALLGRFMAEATMATSCRPAVTVASFSVAGRVEGETATIRSLPWGVDAARLRERLGLQQVFLLDECAAATWGIRELETDEAETLQVGESVLDAPRIVLHAGASLDVTYALPDAPPLSGEGARAGFAPMGEEQAELWHYLRRRLGRVSQEHVLSSAGLSHVYAFVRERAGISESRELQSELLVRRTSAASTIARFAIERGDPLARMALDLFIACFGATAGDHALNVLARGGVFITGALGRRILPRLRTGGFAAAFNDKVAYSALWRRIPIRVVTSERVGLIGAAAAALAAR